MFDKIDMEILRAVERVSGARVSEVVKMCRKSDRQDSTIRRRLREMDILGAVKLDAASEKGKVFVIITVSGRDVLAERRSAAQPRGAQ
jgi:hypothetical protein